MKRILFLGEDSQAADMLRDAGYQIEFERCDGPVLDTVRRVRPDLILLAVCSSTCADVAEMLSRQCSIPIVAVTDYSPLSVIDTRLLAIDNVRRCVFKPCRPRTFLEAIEDVLARP